MKVWIVAKNEDSQCSLGDTKALFGSCIKRLMRHFFIFAIFSLILQSCKKEKAEFNVPCNTPTSDKLPSKSLIRGDWIWVSELYWDQRENQLILKTPQTEGYTRNLVATSRELEFRKNSVFESRYLYDFVEESSITTVSTDTSNVLIFKDINTGVYSNYVHFKICNDTLILNFQVISDFKGQEKWARR